MPVIGPETCRHMILLTQAEIDGELDCANAIIVAAHRASCAQCAAAHRLLRATRHAMRTHATYYQPCSDFRIAQETRLRRAHAVAAAVRRAAAPSRTGWPWLRLTASFGVAAMVAAASALLLLRAPPQDIVDSIVGGHVRALQPGHLTDVASGDSHTVMPWFLGKLDFAPPVKNLADRGYPLEGGRLDHVNGRAVAALVYDAHRHPIDLFVWPSSDASDTAPRVELRDGYTVCHWNQQKMTIWVVSDLDAAHLRDFVDQWSNLR